MGDSPSESSQERQEFLDELNDLVAQREQQKSKEAAKEALRSDCSERRELISTQSVVP